MATISTSPTFRTVHHQTSYTPMHPVTFPTAKQNTAETSNQPMMFHPSACIPPAQACSPGLSGSLRLPTTAEARALTLPKRTQLSRRISQICDRLSGVHTACIRRASDRNLPSAQVGQLQHSFANVLALLSEICSNMGLSSPHQELLFSDANRRLQSIWPMYQESVRLVLQS